MSLLRATGSIRTSCADSEVFAGLRLLSRPGSGKLKTVDLASSKEAAALGPVFLTDVAFCDEILGKVAWGCRK